ncbi:hypothetical protein OEZ85_008634 [Tetradesmus obliquus]|uniref:Uncharacterized protein n=1 Tax=Tetradesmus obliquus TaxID=3088 RepID=A0ABY8TJE4_TETOB|nr:hypothetical protein OEZ85_008634 [Tetradesmus obliquus]
MAQQGDKKKTRNVEAITQLKAFEATYKAACRFHGTAPYKPLLALLQKCQEDSLPCNKVLLSGSAVDGAVTSAITECLASYAPVTTLASYGCSLGDQQVVPAVPCPPAGVCPPVPQHLQLNFQNHMQAAQQALSDRFGLVDHIHYRSQPPRPLLEDLSLALGVAGLSLVRLVLDHSVLGDSGISQLATGLGKCSSLRQLSLCYCGIEPTGVKNLAAALAPSSSRDGCGGPARSSAATLPPGTSRLSSASSRPVDAAGNDSGVQITNSVEPKLQHLHLTGNPLSGCGLQHLTPALRCMQDLQVLALADIGVGEADKVQLQGLVHALTVGPCQLAQLDFDANYIGDRAAQLMLTLLPAKPSLLLLKLTGRLSNEVVLQLAALMEQNLKAAKPAKKKKAKG